VEGWAFVAGAPARPPGIDLADLGSAADRSPPAVPDSEPSSPWGSVVGIVLVAGLAAAAVVAVVRRRTGEDAR
jgi:hypothetical protein